MEYLFAYGLLRGEFESPMAELMQQHTQRHGPAKLRAQLFDLGGYPGVIPPNTDNQWVLGELFEIKNAEALWAPLDAFEGIGPGFSLPYEYQRSLSLVMPETGEPIEAWVYWYSWPVDGKVRICSGDYLQRIAGGASYGRTP